MKLTPHRTLILCVVLVCCFFIYMNKCHVPVQSVSVIHDTIKVNIEKIKDSIRVKTEFRTKVITKYLQVRHDSIIPCETKLYYCDTLLLADSALIATYKQHVYLDSLYMDSQSKQLQDTCKYYRKQIRKHKFQKWLIVIGAIGSHAVRN